jgi:hypothetical protein
MSFYSDAPAELLYAMPAVGGAVTATVSTGTAAGGPMLGQGGASGTFQPCELPHNYFSKQGKSIMVHCSGVFVTPNVAIPTIRLALYLDVAVGGTATAGSVLLCQTGIFNSATVSTGYTGQWSMQAFATCTGTGTSGSLQAFGLANWGAQGITTSVGTPSYTMGTGTTTAIAFNTYATTPVYIEPVAWWSATTSTPTMTMTQMFVWGLN